MNFLRLYARTAKKLQQSQFWSHRTSNGVLCRAELIQKASFFRSALSMIPDQHLRLARKKGDSKNDKRGGGGKEEESGPPTFDLKSLEMKMDKAIVFLQESLGQLRAGGRATPQILDKIKVNTAGSNQAPAWKPLNAIAQISIKDAKTLLVSCVEASLMQSIEKSIQGSDLGLSAFLINPNTLSVGTPKISQEYKEQLSKEASKFAEKAKEAVRHARRDAISDLKKFKRASQDDIKRLEKIIQMLTDKKTELIDAKVKQKVEELLR